MLNFQNIENAKQRLFQCDTTVFKNVGNSFSYYLNRLKINNFRHIQDFDCTFEHPVSVIAGTNKVGKTSLLLLMACSHERFMRLDSTTTETLLREHKWNDVLNFTQYENENTNYSYELFWRVGRENRQGEGQRINKAWTGLGKKSSDVTRINAKIRDREVRLIDLERIHPTRNFSNSLMRKISSAPQNRLNEDIEKAFAYILEIPDLIQINRIGSHINKIAYLIISRDLASFIIKNIILTINEQHRNFNRLINIVTSGPINQVKNDYVRHKRNYQQMNIKIGYCCIFDGDYKNDPDYSDYHQNNNEFSFFLYPYTAPEKFLVGAYLNTNPQAELSTALKYSDHHSLFQECVNLGLAVDEKQALEMCWQSFSTTPEYRKLKNDLTSFLLKVTAHFSEECD